MQCKCGFDIPESAKFCSNCGETAPKPVVVQLPEREMANPMCNQCELMAIAQELGRLPLTLTPDEYSRVVRVPISTVYMKLKKGEIPLCSDSPKRIPTIWVMRKLGFADPGVNEGVAPKLVLAK